MINELKRILALAQTLQAEGTHPDYNEAQEIAGLAEALLKEIGGNQVTERAIKFRVWDEDLKKMLDMEEVTIRALNATHSPVMQFTGLKDKNGKEIWDGDLVKMSVEQLLGDVETIGVVEIRPNATYVDFPEHGTSFQIGDLDELEVVGSEHENPELLLPDDK